MVACLIVGLQKTGHKAINFDKLQEIPQGLDENPAQFLARLTEALQKYTKLDPTSAEGNIVLRFSLVAQSCLTLCDPMDCSTPGFLVHPQLLKIAQTHVH